MTVIQPNLPSIEPSAPAPAPESDRASAGSDSGPRPQPWLELGAEALSAAQRWIEVQADRSRQALRRSIVRTALSAALVAAIALWSAAALLTFLSGMCSAFAELAGGREWAGQLLGGGLALALAAAGLVGALRSDERRQLRALRAKHPSAVVPEVRTP